MMRFKLTNDDIYYFKKGNLYDAYDCFGAHLIYNEDGTTDCLFRVYAENAKEIYVFGDFNNWNENEYKMNEIDDSKIFEIIVKNVKEYQSYKYIIHTFSNKKLYKADPFAFFSDVRPSTNSKIYDYNKYQFNDQKFKKNRKLSYNQPVLIYELHLGSFKYTDDTKEKVTYRNIADYLINHLKEHHFTHVEFLPLYEHPLDDSWGYMTTGYFAPTSRFGNPDDLKYLIDKLHENNIGVIFDFVVSHICKDSFGLYNFDDNYLYDYKEEDIRENKEWGTANLDLGKGCTKSLLFSSAFFFLKNYHIDGFRIDAVSNIIYYLGRQDRGVNEGALSFLQEFSDLLFAYDEKILYIAEDSTSFPNVTKRSKDNGVGFNYKWDMGFMHDTLDYFELDPIYRKYHHNNITFGMMYRYNENYMLVYSHDEVVHGKKSLLNKMPGSYEDKFRNYKALLGLFFTYPGKKTLFMGFEFGQFIEWNFKRELDWFLLDYESHNKLNEYVKDLSALYREDSCFWYKDFDPKGFKWIDADNKDLSLFTYYRFGKQHDNMLVIINCTPNTYEHYRIGVMKPGTYKEVFNSDNVKYGGSGFTNQNSKIMSEGKGLHNMNHSIGIKIAGLSVIILKEVKSKRGVKHNEN